MNNNSEGKIKLVFSNGAIVYVRYTPRVYNTLKNNLKINKKISFQHFTLNTLNLESVIFER